MNEAELRLAICLLAESNLLLWRFYRGYVATYSPQDGSLERMDELIAELENLYHMYWQRRDRG